MDRRDLAYTYTAVAGLLIMAFHTLGLGVLDPGKVLNAASLIHGLPDIWPYLVLTAGVAAGRRWARDFAAPTALLALLQALAVLPRYEFLGLIVAHDPRLGAHAPQVWRLFRRQLEIQGLYALICGGALYALSRRELISRCARLQRQPEWTTSLGFAGALLLVWEFFAASQALDQALYALAPAEGPRPSPDGLAWTLGTCALALAALVGLWRRRAWGWLAAGAHALLTGGRVLERGWGLAADALARAQAPGTAPFLAGEAFCRLLPELCPPLCALAALVLARRVFWTATPPPRASLPGPEARPRNLKDYAPW